jgi:hypothetical protein
MCTEVSECVKPQVTMEDFIESDVKRKPTGAFEPVITYKISGESFLQSHVFIE